MEMKQIYSSEHYKIMNVLLNEGESMPRHRATSDAFIIVQKGKGKLSFDDRAVELQQGSTQQIPANAPHKLEIMEDFSACVIMAKEAEIKFG